MNKTKEDRIQELRDFLETGYVETHYIDKLTKWLDDHGFFTAPASTRFHGAYEGGLFDHSIMVAQKLVLMTRQMSLQWELVRSPYIVGILHDICKCDAYIKQEDGTYKYNDKMLLTGHGDKSAILANSLMVLTEEETLCIRYHMGAYESEDMWKNFGAAIGEYPNVLWTHSADMYVSKVYKI